MIRPQNTPTRERVNLSGLWSFRLDHDGVGREERWFAAPLSQARAMAVPASFNDLVTDQATREFFGDIWYQRRVRIPRGWTGEQIVLTFESATHRATVWVDGEQVGSHEGGYLPFEIDTTDQAEAGAEVLLTVCVNNTLSFQSIPPGVIEDSPTGRKQIYWHDFFNYAGIHRPVWLWCRPTAHIEDVTVVTDFEGSTGSVRYEIVSVGDSDVERLTTRVTLIDEAGAEVASAQGATGALSVPDVTDRKSVV